MPSVSTLFIQQNAQGAAQPVFPGGVEVGPVHGQWDNINSESPYAPATSQAVRWVKENNAYVPARIYGEEKQSFPGSAYAERILHLEAGWEERRTTELQDEGIQPPYDHVTTYAPGDTSPVFKPEDVNAEVNLRTTGARGLNVSPAIGETELRVIGPRYDLPYASRTAEANGGRIIAKAHDQSRQVIDSIGRSDFMRARNINNVVAGYEMRPYRGDAFFNNSNLAQQTVTHNLNSLSVGFMGTVVTGQPIFFSTWVSGCAPNTVDTATVYIMCSVVVSGWVSYAGAFIKYG